MIDWKVRRCNEFSLFLAYAIHAVIHNFKMNELNHNLQKMNKEIEEFSFHDAMTGIYNRRGFFQKTRHLIQKDENIGKDLCLFFVDMDGLKHINDNYGHTEGDFAITALAKVLSRIGDDAMICARVGGDEFICAYVEEDIHYTEETFIAQMKEYLHEVEHLMEKPYAVSASVGMVSEKISKDMNLDNVINRADGRMYEQKSAKRRR